MLTSKSIFSYLILLSFTLLVMLSFGLKASAASSNDDDNKKNNGNPDSGIVVPGGSGTTLPGQNAGTTGTTPSASTLSPSNINNINNSKAANGLPTVNKALNPASVGFKVGSKALKALLKKVGKKGWNAMMKMMPVKVNWDTINKIADATTGWTGNFQTGLMKFLKKHHIVPNWAVRPVAWIIINLVF